MSIYLNKIFCPQTKFKVLRLRRQHYQTKEVERVAKHMGARERERKRVREKESKRVRERERESEKERERNIK